MITRHHTSENSLQFKITASRHDLLARDTYVDAKLIKFPQNLCVSCNFFMN